MEGRGAFRKRVQGEQHRPPQTWSSTWLGLPGREPPPSGCGQSGCQLGEEAGMEAAVEGRGAVHKEIQEERRHTTQTHPGRKLFQGQS